MMQLQRIALCGGAALVALSFGGCGKTARQLGYAKLQISEQQRQIDDLEAQLAAKQAELDALRSRGPAPVAGPVATPTRDPDFDDKFREGERVLSIDNEILFKPGSAVLSDTAKGVLGKVIALINREHPGKDVRVVGHTDNQPIRRSKDKWENNWDLSGGRALAVLQYLEGHGLPAKQLGFAGYGMERPRVPNTSPANQAKNRRVEIVVILSGGR